MDHKSFLAGLPPEAAAALARRDTRRGLAHLAGHLALIGATGSWIALHMPLWWLVLPVHGVFLIFLFALEHETTHRTPFADDRLNDWAGRAAGLVLVLPFTWFRYFHLAHHRWTNDPARDPELLAGAKPRTRAAFAWHISGLPVWIAAMRQLWKNAAGTEFDPWVPPRARPRIVAEARWMLVIYVLLFRLSLTTGPWLLWLWVVPLIFGQPVLRLFLLAEHARCAFVADMFANTRTTFTTRAVRFLAWNMPYHAEHHVMPQVPFHRLPQAHRLMAAHLGVTAPGYAAFTCEYVSGLDPARPDPM